MIHRFWVILMLLVITVPGHAAWLQYRTSDGVILGVFSTPDDIHLGSGEAEIEWMPGTAPANLDWPDPPGCTNGRWQWSTLNAGNTVPPVVNPAFVFFSCKRVANAREVWAIVDATYNSALISSEPLTVLKNRLNAAAIGVCPPMDDTPSSACQSVATRLATMNNVQVGDDTALDDLLSSVNTMIAGANALISANGW